MIVSGVVLPTIQNGLKIAIYGEKVRVAAVRNGFRGLAVLPPAQFKY